MSHTFPSSSCHVIWALGNSHSQPVAKCAANIRSPFSIFCVRKSMLGFCQGGFAAHVCSLCPTPHPVPRHSAFLILLLPTLKSCLDFGRIFSPCGETYPHHQAQLASGLHWASQGHPQTSEDPNTTSIGLCPLNDP